MLRQTGAISFKWPAVIKFLSGRSGGGSPGGIIVALHRPESRVPMRTSRAISTRHTHSSLSPMANEFLRLGRRNSGRTLFIQKNTSVSCVPRCYLACFDAARMPDTWNSAALIILRDLKRTVPTERLISLRAGTRSGEEGEGTRFAARPAVRTNTGPRKCRYRKALKLQRTPSNGMLQSSLAYCGPQQQDERPEADRRG